MTDQQTRTATAIAWYRANRDRISEALPLVIGPATYLPTFCDRMDTWAAMVETLPPSMAESYICRPLRAIREKLRP